MVSERAQRWLESLSQGEARLEDERTLREAQMSASEKVELAFRMAEEASTYAGTLTREPEVAPIQVWLRLKSKKV